MSVASRAGRLRSTLPGARRREFEALALVHLDVLYRFALRLTSNRTEAEDLVQDTCLRAWAFFDRFEPGTHCRAWLFAILRNIFLNRIRRRHHELLDDDANPNNHTASVTAPPSQSPEVEFYQRVLPADVEKALRALPGVFREAVILVDLEEFSYQEAAETLACPVGTVMSRLSRGRRLLRCALQGAATVKPPEDAPR